MRRSSPLDLSYTLPEYVDDENLTARLADGVVTLRNPKQDKAKPKKIQIASGRESKYLEE